MRKNIYIYIKELLETTDCVVIPGLGAFVGEFREAHIITQTHLFSPPFKEVMFNDSLVRDDGVLTHYISLEEEISYQDAQSFVRLQANEWKSTLLREGKLEFESIGRLTLNKEGNFIFSPTYDINFLEDSFGLQEFMSPAIRQQTNKRAIAIATENSSSITFVATFLLLFTVLISWFFFQWNTIDNQYSQQSTIVPSNAYKPNHKTTQFDKVKTSKPEVVNKKESEESIKEESKDKKKASFVETKKTNTSSKMHYIVAGAFRDSRNAKKLIQKLKEEGFRSGIAGLSSKGLLIVYYDAYPDAKQAIKILKEIKKNHKPSAWLYSK